MALIPANTPTVVAVPAGFKLQFGAPVSGSYVATLPGGKTVSDALTDNEGIGPYQSDASISVTSTVQTTCWTIRRDGNAAIVQSTHLAQVPFLPGVSVFVGESASAPATPAGWFGTQFQSLVSGAGLSKLVGDQLAAPVTNLTSATGAAGALTGAYYYAITFISAQGETAPWPGTATVVNVTAQQVNLTGIPLGPAGTTARRIYRTPATPTDPKDYRFLAEISDNTTTTYTDNTADGSLGSPVSWAATNRGVITDGSVPLLRASDQSTAVGYQAMANNVGYASVAVGYQALYANTTGRRNAAVGVYALTALTTGYENAALGVHAGQNVTTGRQSTFVGAYSGFNVTTHIGNTFLGYYAGNSAGLGAGSANYNVGIGFQATKGATASGVGDYNVGAGYLALSEMAGVGSCIGIGPWAGRYANNNRQVFIDTIDRGNIAGEQDSGLVYGKAENTAQTQVLHLNANVRLGWANATVSQLPAASATYKGFRAHVTDASAAYTSANVGSTVGAGKTVTGGGANIVPVFCNGTDWVVG